MSDISKLNGMDLSTLTQNFSNPAQDIVDRINTENQERFRTLEVTRRKKEAEDLRRHNELVAALKEAGDKGATIVIGDNANGIQIQQNSAGVSQTMENSQGLDYEKTKVVLKEIISYFDYPQFEQTFGDNTENVKCMVNETMDAVEKKEDEGLIKKSLHLLRKLAVGTGESMIASGILALIGTLPIG